MRNTPDGTPRRRRQDNIKIDLKHLGFNGHRVQCRTFVNTAMILKMRFRDETRDCQLRNTFSHGISYILSWVGVAVDGVWIGFIDHLYT
jgi:hypothetical protein